MMRCVRVLFDVRAVYAFCGIACSVVAHELLHAFLHIGDISSVHIFPDWATVVSIIVHVPAGYDILHEELVAYVVTIGILVVTALDVVAIHDSRDTKTVRDSLPIHGDILNTLDDTTIWRVLSDA